MLLAALYSTERLTLCVVDGAMDAHFQELHMPTDRIERRAQLVAHSGEELTLGMVGSFCISTSLDLIGDIQCHRDHSGYLAVGLGIRMVEEREIRRHRIPVAMSVVRERQVVPHVRNARSIHIVEQRDKTVRIRLGKNVAYRFSEQLSPGDETPVERIGELEDVVRSANDTYGDRRLLQHVG